MLMSIIERIDVIQRYSRNIGGPDLSWSRDFECFVHFFRRFDQDNFQLAELTDLRNNLFKARSHPSSTKLAALYAYVRASDI